MTGKGRIRADGAGRLLDRRGVEQARFVARPDGPDYVKANYGIGPREREQLRRFGITPKEFIETGFEKEDGSVEGTRRGAGGALLSLLRRIVGR